ncbi:MAG: bifunctional hydroxymethylpyrimidine kinase/phosphomethylpyrimidine kinase [Mariprofundaceae bacterium]
MKKRPLCLSIGGSDSCGGAGIQADLRMFESLGAHGCSAITALTAQNPQQITHIEPASLAHLDMEMQAVFDYYDVAAAKTGMLVDAEHVAVVAASLEQKHIDKPLVLDPVMIASSGTELLDAGGRDALTNALIPLATLITPNLEEAAFWLGRAVRDAREDALALAGQFDTAVLLKGGHGEGEKLSDVLAAPDGSCKVFEHARKPWDEQQRHGTGCRLAAAIAAYLATGEELIKAVRKGIASARKAA